MVCYGRRKGDILTCVLKPTTGTDSGKKLGPADGINLHMSIFNVTSIALASWTLISVATVTRGFRTTLFNNKLWEGLLKCCWPSLEMWFFVPCTTQFVTIFYWLLWKASDYVHQSFLGKTITYFPFTTKRERERERAWVPWYSGR
jgi:hypothetical protein